MMYVLIATGPFDWVTSPQGLFEAVLGDGGGFSESIAHQCWVLLHSIAAAEI